MKVTQPNFSQYPLAYFGAAFTLGIFFSSIAQIPFWVAVSIALSAVVAAVLLPVRVNSMVVLLVGFLAAGAVAHFSLQKELPPERIKSIYDSPRIVSGEPVEIEGILAGKPERAAEGLTIQLAVESLIHDQTRQTALGNIRLFAQAHDEKVAAEYTAMNLAYGTKIRVACELEREEKFRDPGVVSAQMMDQRNIDAVCSVKSPLLIEVLGKESVFYPLAWIYDRRADLIERFRQDLRQPASGVLIAALLGDRQFLDKDTADIFREGGTFHVLVISGLHITFLGGLILLGLRSFTRKEWLAFLISATLLWAYTIAVGAEVPTVRATVMFTVLAFARVVNRKGTMLNSLGLCSILILVWRPGDLFTASFQLTFVSVGSIVLVAFPLIEKLRSIGAWTPSRDHPFPPQASRKLRRFCEALYWQPQKWEVEKKRNIWTARLFKTTSKLLFRDSLRKIASYIFEALIVSSIVQLAMLPLVVTYFHRVSVASVLLNLWVGFFIAIESFAAVLGVVISSVSRFLSQPFFSLAETCNLVLMSLPRWFVDGGLASFRLPAYTGPGRLVYLFYAVAVTFLGFVVYRWDVFSLGSKGAISRRSIAVGGSLLIFSLAVIVSHPYSSPRPDGKLHIDFLDVGQGDSALLTFPDGETMLVDGGGRGTFRSKDESADQPDFQPDHQRIGEAVVSAFLWEKGYSRVDYILATHADADHIQGLSDVAKNFGVRYAFFGREPTSDPDFKELAEVLSRRSIPSSLIERGDEIDIGGVSIKVLYPRGDNSADPTSDNDHSVVLRISFRDRTILMTGDIERSAEADLLSDPESLSADVIKVAHHGSKTSSTQPFVDAVKPTLAIISVGRHSIFGHPNPEVVNRWLNARAQVFTTGQSGTVTVITDGKDLNISAFVP